MIRTLTFPGRWLALALALIGPALQGAGTFRVATYNVENYLDQPTASRPEVKSPEARSKIRELIRAANPDVLALEEMGSTNALLELRAALKTDGCDFPWWEHVSGPDTNIHVALLSKLPIIARRPHTNEAYLLDGRRFRVSRGFAEVDLRIAPGHVLTVFAAHLKSRRPVPEADEAEQRFEEAKILRHLVDARLQDDPEAQIAVLGDFNDLKNSDPVKTLIGHGRFKLTDTRPAERNGDNRPNPVPYFEPRNITWTHYFGLEDSYSRIDYILLSPALARDWVKRETFIPVISNWGIGSDHRPIVAGFSSGEN